MLGLFARVAILSGSSADRSGGFESVPALRLHSPKASRWKEAIRSAIAALERKDYDEAERQLQLVFRDQVRLNLFSADADTLVNIAHIKELNGRSDTSDLGPIGVLYKSSWLSAKYPDWPESSDVYDALLGCN